MTIKMPSTCSYLITFILIVVPQAANALVCYNCTDVKIPRLCENLKECDANETCFVSNDLVDGNPTYSAGCLLKPACDLLSTMLIGKRATRTHYECCNTDHCNNEGFGLVDLPRWLRGPHCYYCNTIGKTFHCLHIRTCRFDEVCTYVKNHDNQNVYEHKCIPKSTCDQMVEKPYCDDTRVTCCDKDYCNNKCIDKPSPSTTPSTTAFIPTTQTSATPSTTAFILTTQTSATPSTTAFIPTTQTSATPSTTAFIPTTQTSISTSTSTVKTSVFTRPTTTMILPSQSTRSSTASKPHTPSTMTTSTPSTLAMVTNTISQQTTLLSTNSPTLLPSMASGSSNVTPSMTTTIPQSIGNDMCDVAGGYVNIGRSSPPFCVKVYTDAYTFPEAVLYCDFDNAKLVSPTSAAKMSDIRKYMQDTYPNIGLFYVGVLDSSHNQTFYEYSNGDPATYLSFMAGEPSISSLCVGSNTTKNYDWQAIECSTKLPSMCEGTVKLP